MLRRTEKQCSKKTLLHGTRLTRPPDSSRTAAAAAINKTRLQHRKNTIFSAEEEMRYKLRPSWIFWVRKFDYGSGEASWCMDWRTGEANRVKGIQNDSTDANMSIMHHHCHHHPKSKQNHVELNHNSPTILFQKTLGQRSASKAQLLSPFTTKRRVHSSFFK